MNIQALTVADSVPGTFGGPWLPGLILAQLYLLFFVYLAWSGRRLPERVTTHFSLFGRPNNYMRRGVYLVFISIFAMWLPLFGGIWYFLGKAKPDSLHVPHQAYWLAPERIAGTQAYLLSHWLWFACLMAGFVIGLHFVIVRANRQQPARLPWPLLALLLAYLAAGVIWWSTSLPRHFSRPQHIPDRPTSGAGAR